MFNKDAYWFGILVGFVAPLLFFAVLYGALQAYQWISGTPADIDTGSLQLISTAINLIFIRYYLVNKKYDETGRGILLITFIFVIAFFVINGLLF